MQCPHWAAVGSPEFKLGHPVGLTSPGLTDHTGSWTVLGSRVLHAGTGGLLLREDLVGPPDSDRGIARLVLAHPGSAVVLAVDDEEHVLCLRQYRHAVATECIELPAGARDGTEGSLPAARRELGEEGGITAHHWRLLSSTLPSAGISNERVDIYLATQLEEAPQLICASSAEERHLRRFWVPLEQLLEAVLSGRVSNAQLCQAVMAYVLTDPSRSATARPLPRL